MGARTLEPGRGRLAVGARLLGRQRSARGRLSRTASGFAGQFAERDVAAAVVVPLLLRRLFRRPLRGPWFPSLVRVWTAVPRSVVFLLRLGAPPRPGLVPRPAQRFPRAASRRPASSGADL